MCVCVHICVESGVYYRPKTEIREFFRLRIKGEKNLSIAAVWIDDVFRSKNISYNIIFNEIDLIYKKL